jgi:hypothetical protein
MNHLQVPITERVTDSDYLPLPDLYDVAASPSLFDLFAAVCAQAVPRPNPFRSLIEEAHDE